MNDRKAIAGPVLPEWLASTVKAAFADGAFEPMTEAFGQLLGVNVSGLMVYGSRASQLLGAPFGFSDVDLLLLADEPVSGGVFGRADDIEIDLHLHDRRDALTGACKAWVLYAGGRVLFDRRPPELENWLDALSSWRRDNPNPWSSAEVIKNRAWADRIVAKLARSGQGGVEMLLHEARLLATLPTLHAQARGRHPTSITCWWSSLKVDDPDFAERLRAYLSDRPDGVNPAALKELVKGIYHPAHLRDHHAGRAP